MKTIHVVSHTHWDREWYRTFQQFRLKLVHLVDGLLDLLDSDPDFEHFMLDGQTIVLDDYLLMRPEKRDTLREHVRSGRLLIGPWYILPDMFLVSPEAHIRNLLQGERTSRQFGPKMRIGYMPDSFGHIGQMPQILSGFGLDVACLWRGLDEEPAEFWWQAPDGSRVLMAYLRDSYSNGAGLPTHDLQRFASQLDAACESLIPHTFTNYAASALNNAGGPHVLIMLGTDHMEPPRATSAAIAYANSSLEDARVIHSTLPDYVEAVENRLSAAPAPLPTVTGELRACRRMPLLPGVLSTRIWIKQRNHACENLLEKWAEPFSAFQELTNACQPPAIKCKSSIIREAWRLLMENHPHDSICGCSIDQVHNEMRPRFDQVGQIGEELTRQSLETLAASIQTDRGLSSAIRGLSSIVVFNPSSFPRTDLTEAELSLPPGLSAFEIVDETGSVIPHQSTSGKAADLINVRVRREELSGLLGMVHEGRVGNLSIQDIRFERDGAALRVEAIFAENTSPDLEAWNAGLEAFREFTGDTGIQAFHIHARLPDSANITFTAAAVPGLGWKTFYVRAKENPPAEIKVTPLMRLLAPFAQKLYARFPEAKSRPPYRIENNHLSAALDESGLTLTLTDKKTGEVYRGLNRFVDEGDCGDEYNFSPLPHPDPQPAARLKRVSIHRSELRQTLTLELELRVPACLSADRQARSVETVSLPIVTRVSLAAGAPRLDIHTTVENRARDHRLRVHFPAPFAADSAEHDGHFEIVRRPLGPDLVAGQPHDPSWIETPRPEVPQRVFTRLRSGAHSLTLANRGLPEVETLRRPDGNAGIALTLLRCVGWLSRDDFSTRRDHAGPFLETPEAQMIGQWEFDYSVIVGQDEVVSCRQACAFDLPLRAASTSLHEGTLPPAGSFVNVDNPNFIVSAVKMAEDGRGWLLRGYNLSDSEIPVILTPWRAFEKVERVNLAEEKLAGLSPAKDGSMRFTARGHEIVTVMFAD